MIVAATLVLSMTGCSNSKESSADITGESTSGEATQMEEKAQKVILTVNNQDVSYDELRIYLQSNKEEIESTYGADIWTLEIDDEGTTYESMLKDAVLEEVTYVKLVCSQAESLGISLTEDELLDVDEYTSRFLSNFSEEAMDYYSVDKEIIRKIYKDNVLCNKVYESLTLNVDTNVSEEEARQSVFQYILVGKYGYDVDGNRFEYTSEQLAEAQERAIQLHEEALTTTNFKDFAQANSDDGDEVEITVGKGDMKTELENAAFALKEGEVSELIDTEEGWFIFYCVEEMNQEATDAKKEEIIRERQEAAFEEKYVAWDASKEVSMDEELFDSISLTGTIVQ